MLSQPSISNPASAIAAAFPYVPVAAPVSAAGGRGEGGVGAGGPGGGGGRHGDAVKRVQPLKARGLLASLEGGQQPQDPSLDFMTRWVPHASGVLAM